MFFLPRLWRCGEIGESPGGDSSSRPIFESTHTASSPPSVLVPKRNIRFHRGGGGRAGGFLPGEALPPHYHNRSERRSWGSSASYLWPMLRCSRRDERCTGEKGLRGEISRGGARSWRGRDDPGLPRSGAGSVCLYVPGKSLTSTSVRIAGLSFFFSISLDKPSGFTPRRREKSVHVLGSLLW